MKNLIIFCFLFAAMPLFAQVQPQTHDFVIEGQFLSKCPTCPTKQEKKGVVVWLARPNLLYSDSYETFFYQAIVQDFETAKFYTKMLDNANTPTLGFMQFVTLDDTWTPVRTINYLLHMSGMEPTVIIDND